MLHKKIHASSSSTKRRERPDLPKKKESGRSPYAERIIRLFSKSFGVADLNLTRTNPKTAESVWKALPFESRAERWGDEVYFKIPVKMSEENSQTVVEVGDVAYWPTGESMCIFFGATPVSEGGEPRAYGPVNVFAKTIGDPLVFRKTKNGEKIRAEQK